MKKVSSSNGLEKCPKLRFSEYTLPWKQVYIDEITSTITDYVAAGSFADLARNVTYLSKPAFAQLIRTTDLKSSFNGTEFIYVDENAFNYLWRVNLDKESIIMPNVGNCGEIYYVTPEILPYPKNVLGPNAILVRSDSQNNKFLSVLFLTTSFQEKLKLIISPSGQSKFNKTELKKISFFLPNLDEQNKIATLISLVDEKIEKQRQLVELLKKYKKGLFDKIFEENKSIWGTGKLGDYLIVQRGGSPRPIDAFLTNEENGINWIKIGDVSEDSRYITSTKEKIKPSGVKKSRPVYKGDLILSNSMSFGRPYILQIDGCIHDGWLVIRDENNMFDKEYLLQLLSSDYMYRQYKSLAAGGVVNNLNSELVQSTKILIPSFEEQKRVGNIFSIYDEKINIANKELQGLKLMKQSLLQQLFI